MAEQVLSRHEPCSTYYDGAGCKARGEQPPIPIGWKHDDGSETVELKDGTIVIRPIPNPRR